jgi:DeoR/GlpR family transcriptional regulator of sugar metabolism
MPFGAYDRIVSLIELKRAFISITNRVVLMIDSSKFGQQSMYLSVPIENAHTIITDEKAPPETIKQISDTGKEILIVETDTCNIIKRYNSID